MAYSVDSFSFKNCNLINQWILVKLNTLVQNLSNHFLNFQLAEASNGFHAFWLHDFCDQYIESTKFIF